MVEDEYYVVHNYLLQSQPEREVPVSEGIDGGILSFIMYGNKMAALLGGAMGSSVVERPWYNLQLVASIPVRYEARGTVVAATVGRGLNDVILI